MASEATIAFTFLVSTLGGDGTLAGYLPGGIWRDIAPPGTALSPWLVFGSQSSNDVLNATGIRLLTNDLYQVRVVGPQSQDATIENAAARVDALLMPGGQPLRNVAVAGGGVIQACFRVQQIAIPEVVAGSAGDTLWRNRGGVYRIQI